MSACRQRTVVWGQSLFGLQFSNPVDTEVAYRGNASRYGQPNDPMVGRKIGGVNVFGGGLGLYNSDGEIIGALGVSGDTSCTDHNVAWKVRDALLLDHVPAGVGAPGDNIVFDLSVDPVNGELTSAGGFGHPACDATATAVAAAFGATHPVGDNPWTDLPRPGVKPAPGIPPEPKRSLPRMLGSDASVCLAPRVADLRPRR